MVDKPVKGSVTADGQSDSNIKLSQPNPTRPLPYVIIHSLTDKRST